MTQSGRQSNLFRLRLNSFHSTKIELRLVNINDKAKAGASSMNGMASFLCVLSWAAFFSACGGGGGGGGGAAPTLPPPPPAPPPPPPPTGLSVGPEICTGGNAGDFSCSGVSLSKRVSLETMNGTTGSDLWGWADAQSGNEYALMGMTNGTAFVDVTDPENPVFLGLLPTKTVAAPWRDIKVYQDHAYVVAETAGAHGVQVFDLTR